MPALPKALWFKTSLGSTVLPLPPCVGGCLLPHLPWLDYAFGAAAVASNQEAVCKISAMAKKAMKSKSPGSRSGSKGGKRKTGVKVSAAAMAKHEAARGRSPQSRSASMKKAMKKGKRKSSASPMRSASASLTPTQRAKVAAMKLATANKKLRALKAKQAARDDEEDEEADVEGNEDEG